jgi:serine/threonine protein kinase
VPNGADPATTLEIITQICSGMAAAHTAGVLHLDLKPENIIVSEGPDHWTTIIDFGSALVAELSEVRLPSGSPDYMAPEVLRGKPTQRSDIFVVGLIAYELLTGALPNGRADANSLSHLLNTSIPSRYSAGVSEIINRAIALDDDNRFSTIEQFAGSFRDALGFASSASRKD